VPEAVGLPALEHARRVAPGPGAPGRALGVLPGDRHVGQLLAALDDLDLGKDTVVVFTADHGELGGSHGGLRNKGPVSYEQNVHVPMIVVHPDVRGGRTTRALTSHIDLLPTLVSLTGSPADAAREVTKGLPGRDFSTRRSGTTSPRIRSATRRSSSG